MHLAFWSLKIGCKYNLNKTNPSFPPAHSTEVGGQSVVADRACVFLWF